MHNFFHRSRLALLACAVLFSTQTFAHSRTEMAEMSRGLESMPRGSRMPVLTDIKLLHALNIPAIEQDWVTGAAYARLDERERLALTIKAHEWKRCGGFELLSNNDRPNNIFGELQFMHFKNESYMRAPVPMGFDRIRENADIKKAVAQVSEKNLEEMVSWLSSYPDRYNRSANPNLHVADLRERLIAMAKNANVPVQVDVIDHKSTPQKSLRVHIHGKSRPDEIVVMGGHLDSINQGFFSRNKGKAPGADDNASGSSNLIEAFRILLQQPQPERSIEIFWYAGEESGLLGSAEIAEAYRAQKSDVIGVLQLDMTLHPGEGEFTLASMSDFTSAWLREYLVGLNTAYIGAKIIDDRCGYGCSDHASWHRNGFPALMPFEASMRKMNRLIHTEDDVINEKSNFRHSAMFSKIAVAFAMDLANSEIRSP